MEMGGTRCTVVEKRPTSNFLTDRGFNGRQVNLLAVALLIDTIKMRKASVILMVYYISL